MISPGLTEPHPRRSALSAAVREVTGAGLSPSAKAEVATEGKPLKIIKEVQAGKRGKEKFSKFQG